MKKNVLIDNSHKSLLQKVKMFLLDLIGKPKWSIDCDDSNQVCVGKCAVGLQFVIRIRGRNNKVSIGQGCSFNKNNIIFIQGDCNTVCIGNDVVFDQQVSVIAAEGTSVSIGDDCLFAKGVQLRTSDQHLIMNSDKVRVNEGKSICVGKHAWIGADVMICKGGSIGEGAIIGARSVVTKDVPAYSLAVGAPATVKKQNVRWQRKYDDDVEQLKHFGYK